MAFNYQTLKKLTNAAVITDEVKTADIGNSEVKAGKIGNNQVTAAKIGTGAVGLNTDTTTGTLPTNRGGSGLTSIGSSGQMLRTNSSGNGLEWTANFGIVRQVAYTGSTTWYRQSGTRYIHVQCMAGGGGGGGHGESGGAGGYSEEIINVNSISNVYCTIGGGGGGTYYAGGAGNGGSSSFGPYLSAGGGYGAIGRRPTGRHQQHETDCNGNQ